MKRKGLFAIIILVLIFSCVFCIALADEFELRNGIHFGDDLKTIKTKETLSYKTTLESGAVVFGNGTVATIQNCEVNYYFIDDKLSDVLYYIGGIYLDGTKCAAEYATVYQGLCRKYGDPLDSTNGKIYVIQGKAFEEAYSSIDMFTRFGGSGDVIQHAEWIVPVDDYFVKIDQILYYCQAVNSNQITYYDMLSYHQFTDADIEQVNQLLKEAQDEVDNDL